MDPMIYSFKLYKLRKSALAAISRHKRDRTLSYFHTTGKNPKRQQYILCVRKRAK